MFGPTIPGVVGAGVDQQLLQRGSGRKGLRVLLEHVAQRPRRVHAVDLGRKRIGLLLQRGIGDFRGILTCARRVGSIGRAVDLHPQRLKAGVSIGDCCGHVPHLLRRRGIGAVRQKPDTSPQRRIAIADPVSPCRHRGEQASRRFALVFFLDCAAVEPRLAHDPPVVRCDQGLLDQQLRIGAREVGRGHRLLRIDTREHIGDLVALRSQLLRPLAPLAVLPALALVGAGVIVGRKHPAVIAEPLDRREGTARAFLHVEDPLLVLAFARRRGGAGSEQRRGRESEHEGLQRASSRHSGSSCVFSGRSIGHTSEICRATIRRWNSRPVSTATMSQTSTSAALIHANCETLSARNEVPR